MKNIKRLCVVIGIAICSLPVFSQTPTQFTDKDTVSDEKAHIRVEKMPVFPGGTAALLKFICDNLVYPEKALDKGLEGMVVVKFIVDTTGKVINPEMLKSVHPLLDNAAIDVVLKLPLFTPGFQDGKKVNVYYNLPVNFMIEKKIKKRKKN